MSHVICYVFLTVHLKMFNNDWSCTVFNLLWNKCVKNQWYALKLYFKRSRSYSSDAVVCVWFGQQWNSSSSWWKSCNWDIFFLLKKRLNKYVNLILCHFCSSLCLKWLQMALHWSNRLVSPFVGQRAGKRFP